MKRKVAVSLPEDLVAQAASAVEAGRAASVSAYVSEAMAEKARRDRVIEVLEQFDRDLGPPSVKDEAWARRVLGL